MNHRVNQRMLSIVVTSIVAFAGNPVQKAAGQAAGPQRGAQEYAAHWVDHLTRDSDLFYVRRIAVSTAGVQIVLSSAEIEQGDPDGLRELTVKLSETSILLPDERPEIRSGRLVHVVATTRPVYNGKTANWKSYIALLLPSPAEARVGDGFTAGRAR